MFPYVKSPTSAAVFHSCAHRKSMRSKKNLRVRYVRCECGFPTGTFISSSLGITVPDDGVRLTECGHVFCLGCVLDWFDNTHVRFLNSHPEYTPLPAYYQGVLRRPFEYPQEFFKVSMHLTHHPSPQYTCPSCRMTVTRRPVEDFKVKTLVSWLGSVQGVAPPESRIPPGTGATVFDGYSLL